MTEISNGWAFCNAKSCTLVFLGDVTSLNTPSNGSWTQQKAIYFCNEEDVGADSYTTYSSSKNAKINVFCNAEGNTT
ncbi:MAG: hypothetical protein IJW10_02575, partial [Clostridia bacterium]|nr:hypothetical protein [Clostridia bacterium]